MRYFYIKPTTNYETIKYYEADYSVKYFNE